MICLRFNGGPAFTKSEALSFQVATTDQDETDRYRNAIVGHDGQEGAFEAMMEMGKIDISVIEAAVRG
jgi:2-polyprenyl-6-hydroxyphenyl methylase/3-demethylubiquinone-9 3-methyltransferase